MNMSSVEESLPDALQAMAKSFKPVLDDSRPMIEYY